jgi:hypothetical protein
MPTILDACGVSMPAGLAVDGRSLMPLLRREPGWADRTLFTQWHRGDEPELFRSCAARTQQYKLVNGTELYDLSVDPAEQHDIARQQPQITSSLRKQTEAWLKDVSATRGYAPPRIYVGAREEPLTILTRQDWRGPKASWEAGGRGHWEIDVRAVGRYRVQLRMNTPTAGPYHVEVAGKRTASAEPSFSIDLPAGPARIEAELGNGSGPDYIEISRG